MIPLQGLRFDSSEYGYEQGDTMIYKVRAFNVRGWGDYSPENTSGGLMETKPHQMVPVTRDPATTDIAIIINWLALISP